jgi:ribose transport system substrate-binding protein
VGRSCAEVKEKGESMTRFRSVLAVLACGAFVATACGSSKKTTGAAPAATTAAAASAATTAAAAPAATTAAAAPAATTAAAAGGDAGIAAAKANVAKYTTPSSEIGVKKPLTKKPDKKVFAWLECELASCTYITPGIKAATTALGWDLKVVSSKSGDPGPAFQQAIDAGANYIASTGEAGALYKEQAAAAKAKGIVMLSCYDASTPPSAASNILTQCGDAVFVEKTGPLMADWAVADSNGKANVLIVNIPDFSVLVSEEKAYKTELSKNCPTCTVDTLNVTIQDLIGGKVPAAVASKLQANSKINYVFNTFGDLPGGLTAALKSAGLADKVKVYGQDFSKFDLDEIAAGTMGAWSADPKGYAGWLMVDAAARLAVGMPLDEERAAAALPTFVVQDAKTAKEISDAGGDWNPPGMDAAFKKLWGV